MAYGVLAHMNIKGDMKGKFYPELISTDELTMATDYSLTALYGGLGFDLLDDNSTFSIPVYAGIFVERYDVSVSIPETNNVKFNADDTGYLYGGSLAVALSWKIMEMFKLTPYYLYSISFNKPEITGTAQNTTFIPPFDKASQTMTMDTVSAGMAGLALTWMTTDAFSISVSVGGWLASSTGWYNDKYLNGLEMKSVVVALSYTK